MSLESAKSKLIADLLEMWETEAKEIKKPEESRKRIAQKMATAIHQFIKQGVVVTSGSATTQIGKIT